MPGDIPGFDSCLLEGATNHCFAPLPTSDIDEEAIRGLIPAPSKARYRKFVNASIYRPALGRTVIVPLSHLALTVRYIRTLGEQQSLYQTMLCQVFRLLAEMPGSAWFTFLYQDAAASSRRRSAS